MSHPSLPVNSLSDVIAMAKKDPGKLSAGSPPPPTLNYFAIELMKVMAGIDITTVTYKGTGPLTNDLVGGHVTLAFNTIAPALGNIQAGKIKAIAVASPKRSAALPDVPTAAEAGLPGFEAVLYYAIAAPAGTPRPIIERINKEMRAIIASDEISKRIVVGRRRSGAEHARGIRRDDPARRGEVGRSDQEARAGHQLNARQGA